MATIQLQIDDRLKTQADELFKSLGMDTSIAVDVFLNRAISCDGFPFDVNCTPDKETLAANARAAKVEAFTRWCEEESAWAKSVGFKQEDIPQIIKEVRAETQAETGRQKQII